MTSFEWGSAAGCTRTMGFSTQTWKSAPAACAPDEWILPKTAARATKGSDHRMRYKFLIKRLHSLGKPARTKFSESSPLCFKISLRTLSRILTISDQFPPSGLSDGPTTTRIRPQEGSHLPSRRTFRVPDRETGTTWLPASTAALKAPI